MKSVTLSSSTTNSKYGNGSELENSGQRFQTMRQHVQETRIVKYFILLVPLCAIWHGKDYA